MGVEIGLAKSIISLNGKGLEFAKKTILEGEDVSPIPFKDQSAAHRNFGLIRNFAERHNLNYLKVLRFLGYGYKVDPSKNNRITRVMNIALSIPRTYKELVELFLPNNFRSGTSSHEKIRSAELLGNLISTEARKAYKRSSNLHAKLASFAAAVGTIQTGVETVINEEILHNIQSHLSELGRCTAQLRLIPDTLATALATAWNNMFINSIPYTIHRIPGTIVSSKFQQIPEYQLMYLTSSIGPKSLISEVTSCAYALFEVQSRLDVIQLDLLINPVPSIPETPIYLESRRALALYRR